MKLYYRKYLSKNALNSYLNRPYFRMPKIFFWYMWKLSLFQIISHGEIIDLA
jgi:hypothetical protein